MNPTLEKAVSALKAEIGKAFDAKPLPFAGDTGNWSARGGMQVLDLEVCVRAVLLAVREPDEAMLSAGEDEQGDCQGFERVAAKNTFTAMIDAILGEGE